MRSTVLPFVVFLSGCVSVPFQVGKDFDASAVGKIEKGKTTAKDILDLFGAPYHKSPESANGERWTYLSMKGNSSAVGTSVTVAGYSRTLEILFENGIVTNYTTNEKPITAGDLPAQASAK